MGLALGVAYLFGAFLYFVVLSVALGFRHRVGAEGVWVIGYEVRRSWLVPLISLFWAPILFAAYLRRQWELSDHSPLFVWIVAAMHLLQPGRNHDRLAQATANVLESEPPLYLQDETRTRTAALVVAIEFRESSFRIGVISLTDDHCAMQLHARPDVDDDPEKCVREGMRMLRHSFSSCPGAPLAEYVGGGCLNKRARAISDDRIRLAADLILGVHP